MANADLKQIYAERNRLAFCARVGEKCNRTEKEPDLVCIACLLMKILERLEARPKTEEEVKK